MPATRRGKQSIDKSARKTAKWIEGGGLKRAEAILDTRTTTVTIEEYPGHFVGAPIDAANVTTTIGLLYPSLIPSNLPSVTNEGRLYIPTPSIPHIAHPPYLIARFDQVINESVNKRLMSAWDNLVRSGVKFPPVEENRSSSPALHLGIWEMYGRRPRVTGDSMVQAPSVIVAMDKFLYLIGELIAPKLKNLLKTKYPLQYDRQMKAYTRVKTKLAKLIKGRPALDFGGAFFTVAVKEGSSERIHLDFNDDKDGISWVVPFGDRWEGGELCVPQLEKKIPIGPGQVLGGMTRILAHCGAPVTTGRRVILTLLSDKFLLQHAK